MDIDPALLKYATPDELRAIERVLEHEKALTSPADYAQVLDGTFMRPPHIDLINRAITDLVEHKLLKADGTPCRKLMVSLAPRHGKSHLLSTYTPAWFLTKYPEKKVVVAGYEASFAESWGRKVRDVLLEAPDHLAPKLNMRTTASSRWETASKGGMFTAGVGGPLTGRGAHLAIVDDPVKNFQDAQSETLQEATYSWFRSTLLTRLEPGGVVVLIMTRWSEGDLAGRLLTEEADEWHQIIVPALAGPEDVLGRAEGQALWPERYDEAALMSIKESLGSYIFTAMYQGTPVIDGGGIFRTDRMRLFTTGGFGQSAVTKLEDGAGAQKEVATAQISTFGVVDLAASTKNTADFSVFALFGMTPDKELLLLDQYRARVEGADHMAVLERLHEQWKPRFWGIERATYGLTLIQTATRTGRIPIRELIPDKDKVSRAYSAAALMESGRIYMPKGAIWVADWLHELQAFPNGSHDDRVDVLAYAAHMISQRLHAPRRPGEPEPGTLEERIEDMLRKKKARERFHPVLGRI